MKFSLPEPQKETRRKAELVRTITAVTTVVIQLIILSIQLVILIRG